MYPGSGGRHAEPGMVTVGGLRLRVAIRPGSGAHTPLLLMGGLDARLELLQPFVDALAPAFDVVRFDVPGVGGSPASIIPYSFPALAWLVTKMLDRLGYDRLDVLGFSWGGLLAQQFALQYPERCRRLILVSTATGALMVPGRLSTLARLAAPWLSMEPWSTKQGAEAFYGGSGPRHPEYAREVARALDRAGYWGHWHQVLAGLGWTSLPWLPWLRQPTLILSGDADPIVPPINARIMHRLIPRSELYIFHDGHLGLGTRAEELAGVIQRFLTSNGAR